MKRFVKPVLGIFLLTVFIVLSRVFELETKINDMQEWVAGLGVLGPIVFAAIYVVATVLILPGSILTIMAGVIFGSVVGVLTVIVGATVGASLCFLISRYFARDFVNSILSKNEKFVKLDSLVEKNGAIIIAITRLVPLFPFNLLNFGFGLTKVPFGVYVVWSAVCMLPGTILYVVGSDAITTAIREGRVPWVLIGVVVNIMIILALIVKKARGRLKESDDG